MKIAAAPHAPPWPYGAPGQLRPLSGPLDFAGFIGRLSAFSADGILDMGSRVLWHPWLHRLSPTWEIGQVVTETFGPDVIGLAMMFCSRREGLDAEEVDFRLLCWELFSLASFAKYESASADVERRRIVDRWPTLLRSTPFARLGAAAEANHTRGLWMRGRLLSTEMLDLPSMEEDLPRILLVHEALESAAPDPARYREYRKVYFGNEVLHLLRHGLGLIGLVASERRNASPTCPGRFDVFAADANSLDVVDFAMFGKLACVPVSAMPPMGERIRELDDHERKLHPFARPLTMKPGIILDDQADRTAFSYPSPRRLLRSLHHIFIDEYIDFLTDDPDFERRVGRPASSLLGEALHAHVEDVVGPEALAIDARCPVSGKKPDAVWCGERYGVLFEVKARVTPRSDPECLAPDSMLEAWRRCWEGVEQAAEFARSEAARRWVHAQTGRRPAVWVVVLVVDEPHVAERTSFRHATSWWQRLEGTGLSGVAVITFAAFAALLRQLTPDGYGRMVERAWMEAGLDGFEQPSEQPTLSARPRLPQYERAFQALVRGM